jgi:error-prone DNA polymerase
MVHPYLRRRNGEEKVEFPSRELATVLGKTLGVPLFQEQAMKIAIVAAGFTPEEADRLRRAMATFRRAGIIHEFRDKLIEGMVARGYARDFAERCYRQIEGFGTYGFPESHAASFALLVYVSAWIKCHYPAAFAAALLNSQPMGFYAPAQIVRDARDHGVEVRAVDVNHSGWDSTLEPAGDGVALRLGLRQITGFNEADAARLVERRGQGFRDLADLARRAELGAAALDRLARADSFASLALSRRPALWQALGVDREPPPLFRHLDPPARTPPPLPPAALGEEVADDYASLRLSLKAHPMALLREQAGALRAVRSDHLGAIRDGARIRVMGLVLVRQRPGTASGVIFMTLEDEAGIANLIVWPDVFERHRRVVLGARLLWAEGRLQREGIVLHVICEGLADHSGLLARLTEADQPGRATLLRPALARADEVKRPGRDTRPDKHLAGYHSRDFH